MNFILWGLYHASRATIYTAVLARVPKKWMKESRWRWVFVPVQFGVTVLGMHIFREPSRVSAASRLLLNPFVGSREQWIVATSTLALPLQTTLWALMAIAVFSSVRTTSTDFIYFQL